MASIKINATDISTETIKKIMSDIRKAIPVGFNKHKTKQPEHYMPVDTLFGGIVEREYNKAMLSIGTLGGGNHFIEIQKGSDGFYNVMVHSGSRNLGKQVADYYNNLAIELNEKWFSSVQKDKQLAFLPVESQEGINYIKEMEYCVKYAHRNRSLMMQRILNIFESHLDVSNECIIDISHNYARQEHHFNKNVWIHRKGATSARLDEIGIIPGSQGTKSYIVRGLGNADSFNSCSHGAGRAMGRKQAQRELNIDVEIKRLNDMGVIHSIRGNKDLDEAAGAYKDISVVMDNQRDLVDVVTELTPIAVIKG